MYTPNASGSAPRPIQARGQTQSPLLQEAFGEIWFEGGSPRSELQRIEVGRGVQVYVTALEHRQIQCRQHSRDPIFQAFLQRLQDGEVEQSRRALFQTQQQERRERLAARLNTGSEPVQAVPYVVTERVLVERLARAAVPVPRVELGGHPAANAAGVGVRSAALRSDDDDVLVTLSDSGEGDDDVPVRLRESPVQGPVSASGSVGIRPTQSAAGTRRLVPAGNVTLLTSSGPLQPVSDSAPARAPQPRSLWQKIGSGLAAIWNGVIGALHWVGRLFRQS